MTRRQRCSFRWAGSSAWSCGGAVMADGVLGDPGGLWAVDESVDEVVASALVEAAPDGMMMADEQGRILLVNRQVEVLFGYRREDLVGQPVEVLLPERLRQAHGAHRTRFRAEPRTRTMGAGLRLSGRRADGAEFPVEISLSPLRTDAGPAGHRRGARHHGPGGRRDRSGPCAQRAGRHPRRGVDVRPRHPAVHLREPGGHHASWATTATSCWPWARCTSSPCSAKAEFRALIDSLSPGQSHSYTTVHRRKDGTDLPVEAVLQHPVDDRGGGSAWMVSIARDLTARLEMEQRAQAAERDVAVLEDRERIARDLHDRVIQRLFAAGLGIEALAKRVRDPLLAERLTHVVGELDDTIRELRSSIFQLTVTPSSAVPAGHDPRRVRRRACRVGFRPHGAFRRAG